MKKITIILLNIVLVSSCAIKKMGIETYKTTKPLNGLITLATDSTYTADYKMEGYSFGNWVKYGDTLILKSKYQSCCIDSINVIESKMDTSSQCVLFLKLIGENAPSFAYLLRKKEEIEDSLLFIDPMKLNYIIDKKNKNISLKIIQPNFNRNIENYAVSDEFNVELKDTTIICYDYVYDVKNYRFYNNKRFIINKKNKIIQPLEE